MDSKQPNKPPTKTGNKPTAPAVANPSINKSKALASAAFAHKRLPHGPNVASGGVLRLDDMREEESHIYADADACPPDELPPNINIRPLLGAQAPNFSTFQQLLDSIRMADQSKPAGTVISQSMDQFLNLCDKNALMCILSGMMGRLVPDGVQFDSLSIEERKPVYGLLCASIDRLTLPNLISLIHSLIMTNYFNDNYLRVCAALLEKGVQGAFAWQSGLSHLVKLSADVAANAVTVIMATVHSISDPTVLITTITTNLQNVDLGPGVLTSITEALPDLARYGKDMLTIGILYIIQRLFTAINGSRQAQEVLARAPQLQSGPNPVFNLVKDGGVSVYNSLIDLINVVFSVPSSVDGIGTGPTPDTQARHFCLSLVTGVLLSTGNNQASLAANARQKAIQDLNNTRHLLEVLFPEWASDLQQGNIATAIKNAADLVMFLKEQINAYVEDTRTPPLGHVDLATSLAHFPMLTVDLTSELIRRHLAGDHAGRLFGLDDDHVSVTATEDTTASALIRRGEAYLPFIREALLDRPDMYLTPEERAGLVQFAASDHSAGRAATAVNKLFEGLVTGLQMGARLLCRPLQLVRAPVAAMLETPRKADDFSVPTLGHQFIPESMIFMGRFAKNHEEFIERYNKQKEQQGGDDLNNNEIKAILHDIFKGKKSAYSTYIAALKLQAVWGPTHNMVRYVRLKTQGGRERPFIALQGAIIGTVAHIPLSHEVFGDVLPVETEDMIARTIGDIRDQVFQRLGSARNTFNMLCSFSFNNIKTMDAMDADQAMAVQVVAATNPDVQIAVSRADSAAIAEIAHVSESQKLNDSSSDDEDDDPAAAPAPGTVGDPTMSSKGGSRRRRASTAKRNNRRKSHNKKSNKRKSRKQLLSRKKISRRRQTRRK